MDLKVKPSKPEFTSHFGFPASSLISTTTNSKIDLNFSEATKYVQINNKNPSNQPSMINFSPQFLSKFRLKKERFDAESPILTSNNYSLSDSKLGDHLNTNIFYNSSVSSTVDTGYNTKQDYSLNTLNFSSNSSNMSPTANAERIQNLKSYLNKQNYESNANRSKRHEQNQQENNLNMASSPITQIKLKSLQEALVKHYSKDQLSKLGIVIPSTCSLPSSKKFDDKENLKTNDGFSNQKFKKNNSNMVYNFNDSSILGSNMSSPNDKFSIGYASKGIFLI